MMPALERCDRCHQDRLPASSICAACADANDARVADYQREVERRDEMIAAADHREKEARTRAIALTLAASYVVDAWDSDAEMTNHVEALRALVGVDSVSVAEPEAEDPLTPSERAGMVTEEARAGCHAVLRGTGGGVNCELPVHHTGSHREGDRSWPAVPRTAATVCAYCGEAEGHTARCSVTKFAAPEQRTAEAKPIGWHCSRALCDWKTNQLEGYSRSGPCPKCKCTEISFEYPPDPRPNEAGMPCRKCGIRYFGARCESAQCTDKAVVDEVVTTTSPFSIREEDGRCRVYVYHAGLYALGSRQDAETLVRSLEHERGRVNAAANAELADLRALLARAVQIFGDDVPRPETPKVKP